MPKTILIVEDNEQNRLLFRDILEYHGYKVIEAANGKDGVKAAQKQAPDLILMDIQMPVMNGYEALKAIRSNPLIAALKIVALTSFAMKSEMDEAIAFGFDGYISKPISVREFPELIKKYIEG